MSLRLSGGRRLHSPPGTLARPTSARVRQAVLNLLARELPGSRWLDPCCGSGVMACEVLQRGVREVVAIERDRRIAAVARANLDAVASSLGPPAERPAVRVVAADALSWLRRSMPGTNGGTLEEGGVRRGRFDLIYLDPPWPAALHAPLSEVIGRGSWLQPGGTLVWECPSEAIPPLPESWTCRDQRRYGGSTVLLLEQV